ncbi:MAG: hypothetical protein AMXMBFR75_05640 [Candidatus Hinthialibacteria bacterium]|nr:hypothetical protein [bacterium]
MEAFMRSGQYGKGKFYPRKASFAPFLVVFCLFLAMLIPSETGAWTLSDLNPWKQIREYRIFSLTRANPIGVRIMVVPVIDDPVNAMIISRLSGEFANSLRSFANEVWLLTDLPDNPIKQGFYTAIPNILADYRLKNRLSMDLLNQMIPDFECDYVALFEVTDYDRFWVDEDLQHRVGVRAVMYDYESGSPKIEKFFQGGRGRRLEEGAFNEAERIAIKGLVESLEKPLRLSVKEREAELARRYQEVQIIAGKVGQSELAIHQYDLKLMQEEIRRNQELARKAKSELEQQTREKDYWKQLVEKSRAEAEAAAEKTGSRGSSSSPARTYRNPCGPFSQTPGGAVPLMPSPAANQTSNSTQQLPPAWVTQTSQQNGPNFAPSRLPRFEEEQGVAVDDLWSDSSPPEPPAR